MKYIFASILVIIALITVFHIEKSLAVTHIVTKMATTSVGRIMPFQTKLDYAKASIDILYKKRNGLREKISETAVTLENMNRQTTALESERNRLLKTIQSQIASSDNAESVHQTVMEYKSIENRIHTKEEATRKLHTNLTQLEQNERCITEQIHSLQDQLSLIETHHSINNGYDLICDMRNSDLSLSSDTSFRSIISQLERTERIRSDIHERFHLLPPSDQQICDPIQEAKQILAQNAE